MNKILKDTQHQDLKNLLLIAFFTLGVLLSFSFFGLLTVEKEMKATLAEHLQATLYSNIEIINFWFKEKKTDAEVIANNHQLQEKIQRLINSAKQSSPPEELLASPALYWVRDHLRSIVEKYGFVGFVLFNIEGREVGALLDMPVGQSALKERSDFFQRSLKGNTFVSLPFEGEVDLPDQYGVLRKNWPTMFVSTPVKDEFGKIIAVLAFRIRPETEFSELLHITRFGESGETYAFSSNALMLSDSRFNKQLRHARLIPPEPWSPSILKIHIKDPQGNLTEGYKPTLPKQDWPLTKMAGSATRGGNQVETEPYNDYRGVPVVGAWTWLAEHNMGLTSEIDASEALLPMHSLRKSFLALSIFLTMACGLLTFFRWKQIVAEKKQHQKDKKTLDEKLKTQAIMDNVVDAIITIDELGHIQSFNQGAKSLFQYDKSEVIGQNIKMLMPDPDRSQHDEYLKQYLSTGNSKIIGVGREVTGLKKDGTQFPMDLTISKVDLHKGIIFAGIIRDISPRKDFELALIEAKKLSDEANQAKSSFLANMSHEIRTPLNGIVGLTQLTMNTDLNPVQNDFLRKIHGSSQNLLTIINDILDVSKIEAGKMEIEFIELNLEKTLQNVIDLLSPKIEEKGLKFHIDINENVPTSVIGDPVRLSQILTNLSSNAVKFTEQGHITISLRLLEQTQETLNLEFSVQDSGMGISEEHIEKLFKPFSQADATTTRIFGGTGLGLNIAKNLVRLMGGEICVESKLGKGSNFIFNVKFKPSLKKEVPSPIESSTDEARINENSPIKPENTCVEVGDPLPGGRILLAEDNKINQQVACGFLNHAGMVVTVVNNGQEALDILKEKEFDTVLMDIQMPVMDGYRTTRKIRAIPQFQDLPIIALTANASDEDRKKALDCGMNEHIPKPIDANELIKILSQFIPVKSGFLNKEFSYHSELETKQNTEKDNESEQLSILSSLRLENGIKQFQLGEELHIDLLIQFSLNQADTLEKIETAVEKHDIQTAMNMAHGLKGVAGNIGAIALADKAAQIEKKLKHKSLDSNYKLLLNSAKQSMAQLNAGIENLKQQNSTNTTVGTSQPLPEYKDLAPFIEKLQNMISDNNFEALSYLDSMGETFKETPVKELLSPVRGSLSLYKFDQATVLLAKMTKKFQLLKET
jgi:PAS domain S-box-containing protein